MEKDNTVYLLVGPRGAGKSTYAAKIIQHNLGSVLISRDAILIDLFGSEHNDPYGGAGYHAMKILFDRLGEKLAEKTAHAMVLDYWTGSSQQRQVLVEKLRLHGATKVIALFFTTPLALVQQWFWNKPGIAKVGDRHRLIKGEELVFYTEDAPKRDFHLFHKLAENIGDDGFDQIIQVNPLEPLITFP